MSKVNLELVQRICHSFGKTLEEIFSGDAYIKYPTMQLPESLLPYPKLVIEKALDLWIEITDKNNEIDTTKSLQSSKASLDFFVSDSVANEANSKMFKNNDFIESVFKGKEKL